MPWGPPAHRNILIIPHRPAQKEAGRESTGQSPVEKKGGTNIRILISLYISLSLKYLPNKRS